MNTPAISNSTSVNSTAKSSSTKQSAPDSDNMSFSQVLTREMSDKTAPPATPQLAPKETSASNRSNQTNQSNAASSKANNAEESKESSIDDTKTNTATDDGAPVANTKSKTAADSTEDDSNASDASSASDALLALVANLNKPVSVDVDVAANAVSTDKTAVDTRDTSDATAATAIIGQNTGDLSAALVAAQTLTKVSTTPTPTSSAQAVTSEDSAVIATDDLKKGKTAQEATLAALMNGKTTADTSNKNSETESNGFRTALSQAKDAEPISATTTGKAAALSDAAIAAPTASDLQAIKAAREAKSSQSEFAVVTNNVAASPATLQQVQAATNQISDKLTPQVGSPGWDQALGQKVVWMVAGSQQSASLTLNPPDLGPLQVVLSVSNNQATANFTAAQPEVRQALEAAMPKLREMLGDAGIQLGQANVSAGMPNNQQNAFAQQQQQQSSSRSNSGGNGGVDNDASVSVVRSQTISNTGSGLVDTFV